MIIHIIIKQDNKINALSPIPNLFSSSPSEARSNRHTDPARAHTNIQRILSWFIIKENVLVPPDTALELVMQPTIWNLDYLLMLFHRSGYPNVIPDHRLR